MRISLSAAASPGTPAPLLLRNPRQSVLISCDGAGSWGRGAEAADYALPRLAALWRRDSLLEPEQVRRDLLDVSAEVLERFSDPADPGYFEPSFCGIFALIAGDTAQIIHSGSLEAALLRAGRQEARSRPTSIAARLLAEGKATPEQIAANEPLHFMEAGPSIGAQGFEAPIIEPDWRLQPGDLLAVLTRRAWRGFGEQAVWDAASKAEANPALELWQASRGRMLGLSSCALLRFGAAP